MAAKWADPQLTLTNEYGTKSFPSDAETYKYPKQGLNVGSPIYQTTAMQIGKIIPAQEEIPSVTDLIRNISLVIRDSPNNS